MTDDFDPTTLGGSIKRGIVNPDLAEERLNLTFNQSELEEFMLGTDVRD